MTAQAWGMGVGGVEYRDRQIDPRGLLASQSSARVLQVPEFLEKPNLKGAEVTMEDI